MRLPKPDGKNRFWTSALLSLSVCGAIAIWLAGPENAEAAEQIETFHRATTIKHRIIRHESDEFCGWPANHGIWHWDNGQEILVGFNAGRFMDSDGHKIDFSTERDLLARSMDGGDTWAILEPAGYVAPDQTPLSLDEPIDFTAPGLVMRVKMGRGSNPPGLYYSYDKGDR